VADIAEHRRFDWRKPLVAAAVALVVSLLMTIYGADIEWLLYAAVVGILGGIGLLGSIALRAVFRKRQNVLMALAIFGAIRRRDSSVFCGVRRSPTNPAVESVVPPLQVRASGGRDFGERPVETR
jgi:hypothetical protein